MSIHVCLPNMWILPNLPVFAEAVFLLFVFLPEAAVVDSVNIRSNLKSCFEPQSWKPVQNVVP